MAQQEPEMTGWVGWGYFASLMMMILGVFHGIAGLTAIFKENYFVVTANHLLVFNFQTWGWVTLVLGIIIFFAGLELLRGAMWARIVGVMLAALSFLANMSFMNAYPLWSLTLMVVDVLIIYALTVHGSELKA